MVNWLQAAALVLLALPILGVVITLFWFWVQVLEEIHERHERRDRKFKGRGEP